MKDKYFLLNGRSYPDTITRGCDRDQASDGMPRPSQPMSSLITLSLSGGRAARRSAPRCGSRTWTCPSTRRWPRSACRCRWSATTPSCCATRPATTCTTRPLDHAGRRRVARRDHRCVRGCAGRRRPTPARRRCRPAPTSCTPEPGPPGQRRRELRRPDDRSRGHALGDSNDEPSNIKSCVAPAGRLVAAVVAFAAFVLVPGPGRAATPGITGSSFSLVANAGYTTQPDGAQIYTWGYGCASSTGLTYAPAVFQSIGRCPTMQLPRADADRDRRCDGERDTHQPPADRGRQHLDHLRRDPDHGQRRHGRTAGTGSSAQRVRHLLAEHNR